MSTSTERAESSGGQPLEDGAGPASRRTIGPAEFDPLGTLVLIGLYFVVLILMWLFTYFVEFVGNDPTPITLV